MKTLKTVPGQNLVLGHRGENLATRIIFSIAPWVETYGPGTAHLLHQRQGDSEPYPVATLQEGTEVSWDVTDGDTALEGYGKYELRYYVAETLVKSSVGETYTMKALQYGAEPPDPIQGWVDHVLEKENEIYEAASETKGYSEAAERAAGDALNFANAADQSAGNARLSAKTAADQAGQAAGSAKEAKEAAEEARKIVDGADVVKSVNGQAPDKNGNVQIEVGTGSGVDVTAKPGQLIRVKSVDENGKPTAWEAVPWGYTEGGMTYLIKDVEIADKTADAGADGYTSTEILDIKAGETYTIKFNELEYQFMPYAVEDDGNTVILFGNMGILGTVEDTGEPFYGICATDEAGSAMLGIATQIAVLYDRAGIEAPDSCLLSIYQNNETVHPIPGKLLPEGVPYVEQGGMVEIFPESQLHYVEEYDIITVTENVPTLVVGETYAVNWNGTEYTCIGQDAGALAPGAVGLGDLSHVGLSGNGEPFTLAVAENNGVDTMVVRPADGAIDITLSIKGESDRKSVV